MQDMTIDEAMRVAESCADGEYPPTNRNVLVRAMSTLQSAHASSNNFTQDEYERLSISVQVIAAWMLVIAGYTDLTTHAKASALWLNRIGSRR